MGKSFTGEDLPDGLRDFNDYDSLRKSVFDDVQSAVATRFPMENDVARLEVKDLKYEGPETFDHPAQKAAILQRKSLDRRLTGTWQLTDKASGQVLDKRRSTIMHVPYLTERGTYINNGLEYTVGNQLRLRSGVFSRQKDNGEYEAHFNIMKGGPSFRMFMEPETGLFRFQVGQARLKLYPILQAIGVPDRELQTAWGPDIFKVNAGTSSKPDETTITKLMSRLYNERAAKAAGVNAPVPSVKELLERMELDPQVTGRTLGQPYTRVDAPALMATTKKLLAISRKEAEVDDRDSLAFQTTHSANDFFAERVSKDAGKLAARLLWNATLNKSLKRVPNSALDPHIQSVLFKSGLASPLEETNPLDPLDQNLRAVRIGEGGIENAESVPMEARSVQPSHMLYIDPIRAPECYDADTEVMTYAGWKLWPAVTAGDRLACNVNGRLEFYTPLSLVAADYSGEMHCARTDFIEYCVTPNHRMYVRPQGKKDYNPGYRFELAPQISGTLRKFLCGGHVAFGGSLADFTVPSVIAAGLDRQKKGNPPVGASLKNVTSAIDICDWAEFMGWYLSEGSVTGNAVIISQSLSANPDNCRRISQLLDRLPFTWCFDAGDRFVIARKQLASYVKQFGYCNDKFIPEELFEAPVVAKARLLDALLSGDGRKSRDGVRRAMCTSSFQLASGVQRLAFQLGYSTRVVFEPDTRKPTYLGCYIVMLHQFNERVVVNRTARHPDGQYWTESYSGRVYCATVPGGLLYVRRNNSVGFWCGNSTNIGVDSRFAFDTYKGPGNRIFTRVINPQGQPEFLPPEQLTAATVAFPGEMERAKAEGRKRVKAMSGGKLRYVLPSEVNYLAPNTHGMFAVGSNLVPLVSAIKGGRLLMAGKMSIQALPLSEPEAPLVQARSPDGRSFDALVGARAGAVFSQGGGTVLSVSADKVVVRGPDGKPQTHELYNNFPLNRRTYLHNTPVVQPGQTVAPGQILARSNFTDTSGVLATGKNLRTAYMPFRGMNYEDASVISQSAANKLSSEHMYTSSLDTNRFTHVDKSKFSAMFPAQFDKRQFDTIGDDGVVKPGTKVSEGDPLVLGTEQRQSKGAGMLHRKAGGFNNGAITWQHSFPGVVTDVYRDDDGVKVAVRAIAPMQVGDKMSGRYGDKGVVGAIIPDDQMPRGADGQAIDVLLNPLGVISRCNPAQIHEAILGKIARKTGKPYVLDGFSDQSLTEFVQREMARNGVNDREDVWDPVSQRKIPGVLVGDRFMLKLHHTAEGKLGSRGLGAYTTEGEPAAGWGEDSDNPKRVGMGEMTALLSHGALANIRDVKTVKGQRNDDWWKAVLEGRPPPKTEMPNSYRKFVATLQGAGVNLRRRGQATQLLAMTDKDVEAMSAGEITSPDTVRWFKEYGREALGEKSMEPVDGGLFDRGITGGHGGNRWSHYTLSEKLPQPVMETPIRRLLGLTADEFEQTIAGKHKLPNGMTGPQGMRAALASIDLDKQIAAERSTVSTSRGTRRDDAVRRLKYLTGLKDTQVKPEDLMVSRVPILPPIFRPVTSTERFNMMAGINQMYGSLMQADSSYKELRDQVGDDIAGDARLNVYRAFKAVTGLGDPIEHRLVQQGAHGLLKEIFGANSPKAGLFQRRLLGTSVDVAARAAITPNPELDMDHVGIPEDAAWKMYGPYVVRRMVRQTGGRPDYVKEAVRLVSERTPRARQELLKEMGDRPIMATRAPALHRYSIMAFHPVITASKTMQLSPEIVTGFNADFDGDAMNMHVAVSDEAVKEALEKMLPSRNLRSPADFAPLWAPRQEFLEGLWRASTAESKSPPRVFDSRKDVVNAFLKGQISLGDKVIVSDKEPRA